MRHLYAKRPLTWLSLLSLAILIWLVPGDASAHNLSTTMVWMFFDPETQAMYDAKIADDIGYPNGTPIFEVGDEIGLVIKILPNVGTTTGVGGYVDFFLPNGVTVLDAAYVSPDVAGSFSPIALKGQALMPDVGAGGNPRSSLVGVTLGPNILGTTSPIVTGANVNMGTLPGVYGDIGIFYATAPDTAYGSWVASGGLDGNTATDDNVITNNRGNSFTPLNKWDAEQMIAYGSRAPMTTIIDANARGNAPWGLASAVAGPESGYAWQFDKDVYDSNPVPANIPNALTVGPWNRIQYPGSLVANDPPGHSSGSLHAGGADGSAFGYALSPATPLPATTSQSDGVSPKAVRWSIGQLTLNNPEYVWIKFRLDDLGDIVDPNGCATFHAETFGGDAGGDDLGKDHLWRYYWPTEIVWNTCVTLNKRASVPVATIGQTFQYTISFYNTSTLTDLTNVLVTDPLPASLQYVSAVPAPNSTGPLRWIVPSIPRGSKFEATVTVRALGSGVIENTVTATSDQQPLTAARELTPSGSYPFLSQSKSVSPQAALAGGNVTYTLLLRNIGSGPTGNPVRIDEALPAGFTYQSLTSVVVNGASFTGLTTVDATNPAAPAFTVPASIDAGNDMTLVFDATIDPELPVGSGYCNAYTSTQGGRTQTTGAQACVNVVGGRIGDMLYRDWNGNGVQEPAEEGLPGSVIELRDGACTPLPGPGANCPTRVTGADGTYQFTGLEAGTYTVAVVSPPTGYSQTGDPDVAGPCGGSCDGLTTVVLATNTSTHDLADFGYLPGGTGLIGNQVFEDLGNDGLFDPSQGDGGIANVSVLLFEDTNGDGFLDNELDTLIANTSTDLTGVYTFTNLATGLSYLVDVDQTDVDLGTYFTPDAYDTTTTDPHPVGALAGSYQGADFGFFRRLPSSIGDTAFVDLDVDGSYDLGADTPLPNVTISLYRDVNGDGVPESGELRRTTSTTITGTYRFETLGPGSYIVLVDQADPDIPAGLTPTLGRHEVTLAAGEDVDDADFPFVALATKTVDTARAAAGSTLTYAIDVTYPGSDLLTNVVVTDSVPAGTTYAGGASPTPASAPPIGGTGILSWNLGSNLPGVSGFVAGSALCAGSVSLRATVDTYVREDAATNNYVTQNKLETRPNSNRRSALIYFDLSSIPTDAIIDSATLRLVVTAARNDHTANVRQMRTAWVQGGTTSASTWNTRNGTNAWAGPDGILGNGDDGPFSAGDYFATDYGSVPATPNGAKSLNVTSLVQAWRSGTNNGLALIAGGTDNGQASWESTETGAPNTGPLLDVAYRVDTPGGCAPVSPGTGFAIWSDTTGTPLQSTWNGSAFGVPGGAAALAARFRNVQAAEAPFRNERIVVGVINQISDNVVGLRWNGTTWNALSINPLGTASGATTAPATSAAVAYEQESGDAVLVWDDNAQPAGSKLRYAVWNGSVWTSPATITAYAGAEPRQIRLAADPNSDRLIAAISDANGYDYALVWTGAAWGNAVTLDDSAGGALTSVAALFEGQSGDAMVFYGKTDSKLYYRALSSGSWGTEASITAPSGLGAPSWTDVAASPNSNRIALGVVTAGRNVWLNVWNGSAWGSSIKANTKPLSFNDGPAVAVGVEPSSSDILAIYAFDDNKIRYRTWSSGAGWSAQLTGPDVGQKVHSVDLYVRPASDEMMLLVQDDGRDLSYATWDGATFSGDIELENDTGEQGYQPFAFAWDFTGRIPPANGSRTTLSASPSLTGDGASLQITLILTATDVMTDVMASTPLTVTASGATATGCVGPTLASLDNDLDGSAADSVVYRWSCTASAGTEPGAVMFSAAATGTAGTGAYDFPPATSNSVLVAPTMSFQVQIDDPVTVDPIWNLATIADASVIPPSASNSVRTAILASIGDMVWTDLNGNAQPDPGEPGLAGAQVCADDGLILRCATSDASGTYRIFVLDETDSYTVTLSLDTLPAGYQLVSPVQQIVLPGDFGASGGYVVDVDFGARPPGAGSIGDTIWMDNNEDGVLDVDENGLSSVGVALFADRNADGVAQASELMALSATDAAGNYLFANLYAGSYLVRVDESATVTTSYGVTATLGAAMDVVSVAGSTSGSPPLTNLLSVGLATDASNVLSADFGVNWAGAIGDRTWYDQNANDVQDPAELGAGDVTVVLVYDLDGDGEIDPGEPVLAITDSDAAGDYLFADLPPGNYLLEGDESTVLTPPFSEQPGILGRMVSTGAEHVAVALPAGGAYVAADFGFIEAALAEGHVFHDEDGNGVRSGEPGLENVAVTLTGFDITGSPVSLTTTTDFGGEFTFLVIPGSYTVSYSPVDPSIPPGMTAQTTPTAYAFVVAPGEEREALDFGLDHSGTVGDLVFHDVDGNGQLDGAEPGLAGVTVRLYRDTNLTGIYEPGIDTLITAIATGSDGSYRFEGLADATYFAIVDTTTVALTAPFLQTGDPDEPGACVTCDDLGTAIVDAAGGTPEDLGLDFGYQVQAVTYTVSGTVFDDNGAGGGTAGNGIQEPGELGITGVRMHVIYTDTMGVVATVVVNTDASGGYVVSGIPAGSDVVIDADESTLPSPAFQPTTSALLTISAISADQNNRDFGYEKQLGSLAGTVCVGDGGGTCSPGEAPLAGIAISMRYAGVDGLLGTGDDVISNTTTLGDGTYSFGSLEPGLHEIVQTNAAGYESLNDADAGNPDIITLLLTVGANLTGLDFEDRPERPGVIGNRVWIDEDADGVADAGEPGLSNVVVELRDATGATLLLTTTTDFHGGYAFLSLTPDSYQVRVDATTLPAGLTVSNLGPSPGQDGQNQAQAYAVSLGSGQEDLTADFGYNWATPGDVTDNTGVGAFGDTIYIDADGDGFQDPGELGLASVTVTLFADPDGDGVYDTPAGAPVMSGPDGRFIFSAVTAGAYVVAVTPPAGYSQTGDPDATLDHRTTSALLLAPGDVYLNVDFGYRPDGPSASIGNLVWFDSNGNGTFDAGDAGISGVTVALLDASGSAIATARTDDSGAYQFDGVPNGDYVVWVNDCETVVSELAPTSDADGIGTPRQSAVTISGGLPNLDQDFGFAPPDHGAGDGMVGDIVFLDRDGDGQPGSGEGLEGVTVSLYDATGTILRAREVTNENGAYHVGDLPAGSYLIRLEPLTLPSGGTGLLNTVDPDLGTPHEANVTLVVGEVNLGMDFGYAASSPGSISGTVWNDTDADGWLDEVAAGLSGVTVGLRDAQGDLIATSATDANGDFSIGGLPAGNYALDVTDVLGRLQGRWHSLGVNPGTDGYSQADAYAITLASGGSETSADFGYYASPGAVGNWVWLDRDGDGVQDGDEPGLVGVPVTLTVSYPNGTDVTVVTLTGGTGTYLFDNLLLDEQFDGVGVGEPAYTLYVATPPATSPSPLNQAAEDADSDDGVGGEGAVIIQGATNQTLDFGFMAGAGTDLGDLPNDGVGPAPDYPVQFTSGAAHIVYPDGGDGVPDSVAGTPAVWLGAIVDVEADGQPSLLGTGDDLTAGDEDGTSINLLPWVPGGSQVITLTLNSSEPGTVNAGLWLDWNGDGVFDSFYAVSAAVNGPTAEPVNVSIPVSYVLGSNVYVRARAFAAATVPTAADYQGTFVNGEVEDRVLTFSPTAVRLAGLGARSGGHMPAVIVLAAVLLALGSAGLAAGRTTTAGEFPRRSTYRVLQNPIAPGATTRGDRPSAGTTRICDRPSCRTGKTSARLSGDQTR